MKYTHFLFDLDNTILNFSASSVHAFSYMLSQYKIVQESDYYDTYRKINKAVWEELEAGIINQQMLRRKRFGQFFEYIGIENMDALEANALYLEGIVKYPVYCDGALELLESLQGRVEMAVLTNGLKEVQRPRMATTGLDKYFSVIVVSDEIGVAKPQTSFFDYALDKLGYPERSKCLMIGDSLMSDILGANDSNIDSCWYNPKGSENLSGVQAKIEIKNLLDLEQYVH